jgi:hypothetical protein
MKIVEVNKFLMTDDQRTTLIEFFPFSTYPDTVTRSPSTELSLTRVVGYQTISIQTKKQRDSFTTSMSEARHEDFGAGRLLQEVTGSRYWLAVLAPKTNHKQLIRTR